MTDGLPEMAALEVIVGLLELDTRGIDSAAGMPLARRRTCLGLLAAAALVAKTGNHSITDDPLDEDTRYVLHNSAVADLTMGDGLAGLEFARYLMTWVADLVAETTRHDDGAHTPGQAIGHLAAALQQMLVFYIDGHQEQGMVLDGRVYAAVPPQRLVAAMVHVGQATQAVQRLIPPVEPS